MSDAAKKEGCGVWGGWERSGEDEVGKVVVVEIGACVSLVG
jgi:hypothetical protein